MQYREARSDWFAPVLCILQPVALTITLAGGHDAENGHQAAVLVGAILTSLWSALIWGAGGMLRRDQYQGTLGAVIAAGPYSAGLVLLGRALGAAARNVIVVCLTAVGLAAYLGIVPPIRGWPLLILGLVLTVMTGSVLGLLLSCLFLVTRHSQHLSGALLYPVHLLGGLVIPLGMLPGWLRWPGALFSLHWIQGVLVSALRGDVPAEGGLIAAAVLTALYGAAALRMFSRIQERSRRGEGLDF
ncbi:ABC transporter permease [Streptomyces sp. NPDC095817]|uniref:ABC transporter permease n=1 Tax=Streptomyces sp. NPDC095817 TaxID=3155082 RepID=UPI0033309E21